MPKLRSLLALVALVATVAGCGSRDPVDALRAVNETNLQKLGGMYLTFQREHDWQGPPDEEAFKQFIASYHTEHLERIGIDPGRVDELFVSERDGEPFRIRYGVPGSPLGSDAPIIFEATGDGEKRRVAFLDMVQADLEPDLYERFWNGEVVDGVGAPNYR